MRLIAAVLCLGYVPALTLVGASAGVVVAVTPLVLPLVVRLVLGRATGQFLRRSLLVAG